MLNNKKVIQKSLGFQFSIHQDHQVISSYSLPNSKFFIGREETSLVCLNDPSVSPLHACVTPSSEGGEIIDLMSENGIYINGQKVSRGHFAIGDRILIGSVELRVSALGEKTTQITQNKQDQKAPSPSPSPVSPLTLIDGEYCDITFDDGHFTPVNTVPILKQDFSNSGYIDFHDDEEEGQEIIHKEHSGKALEVTILLNGTVMSVDYLSLKNKTYSIGAIGQKGKTIALECLNGHKARPFIKIKNGEVQLYELPHFKGRYITKETGPKGLPIEKEIFEFKPQSVLSLERKTVQIFIRHLSSPPPTLKAAPFFTQGPDERYTALKVFSTLMALMLLILFVDTTHMEIPKKKISVIYRAKPTPQKKMAHPQKTAKAQPKKLKRKRQSSKKQKNTKLASLNKKAPIKSYLFSAKGQLNSFFKSAKSAKASKLLKNTANTQRNTLDIARNLSPGRATASIPSARLGNHFKGKYDHSVGSQGLSQKRGISTADRPPIPKVLLGLMDPELLRQILREYMPQFRHCYQKELLRNDKVEGVIHLKFRIVSQGRIKNAAVQSKRAKFSSKGQQCMLKVLSLIEFPSPKGGGVVDINQPLNFTSSKV